MTRSVQEAPVDCLSEDTLLDLFAGTLSHAELAMAERHLDQCAACRDIFRYASTEQAATPPQPPSYRLGEPILPPDTSIAQRYRIVRFIGRGGMGEVYEAEDRELGEAVALKTLNASVAADPIMVSRLKREVQLARKVTHPHVCRIFDLGYDRRPSDPAHPLIFLTMELLLGETLRQRVLRDGPLPVAQALPIARQLASGLTAAHAAGVIHRDFKSDNVVLLGAGQTRRAVITDFGLARADVEVDARISTSGALVGTPAYMAPEQVTGSEVTPSVDLYSFGIVLFELLTGELPFNGRTPMAMANERLQRPAPSARAMMPDLSPALDQVILTCLEREPADRFADAPALERALAEASTAPQQRRLGGLAPALGLGALAAAALLGWQLTRPATSLGPKPRPLPVAGSRPSPPPAATGALPVSSTKPVVTAAAPATGVLLLQIDAVGARLEIDGRTRPVIDGGARAELEGGRQHVVVVSAPGHRRWRDSILVPSDETVRVPVKLHHLAAPRAADPANEDEDVLDPYPARR